MFVRSLVLLGVVYWFFFFFKQKTAYEMRISDWSSDVCSSDLTSYPSIWRETPSGHWSVVTKTWMQSFCGSLLPAPAATPATPVTCSNWCRCRSTTSLKLGLVIMAHPAMTIVFQGRRRHRRPQGRLPRTIELTVLLLLTIPTALPIREDRKKAG